MRGVCINSVCNLYNLKGRVRRNELIGRGYIRTARTYVCCAECTPILKRGEQARRIANEVAQANA